MIAGQSSFMAGRIEPKDSLDDFPTHPWATRALIKHVLGVDMLESASVWEPAANRGYMVRPLQEYARQVWASDVFDYGAGYPVFDFLSMRAGLGRAPHPCEPERPDWIITNPPFNDLEKWIEIGLDVARDGCAFFVRTQVLAGAERYKNFMSPDVLDPRQWLFSQFVERVPLKKGEINHGSTMTDYGWLIFFKAPQDPRWLLERRHIPPGRAAALRRPQDYR